MYRLSKEKGSLPSDANSLLFHSKNTGTEDNSLAKVYQPWKSAFVIGDFTLNNLITFLKTIHRTAFPVLYIYHNHFPSWSPITADHQIFVPKIYRFTTLNIAPASPYFHFLQKTRLSNNHSIPLSTVTKPTAILQFSVLHPRLPFLRQNLLLRLTWLTSLRDRKAQISIANGEVLDIFPLLSVSVARLQRIYKTGWGRQLCLNVIDFIRRQAKFFRYFFWKMMSLRKTLNRISSC